MSYNAPFNPLGQPGSPAIYQALLSAIRQIFRWLSRADAKKQDNQTRSDADKFPGVQQIIRSEQVAVDHDPNP
jgi:hypothetical protein